MPLAFHRRSATNHSCVIIRGLTHVYHQLSLRDGRRLPILGEVNRSTETGFADTFDQLDQGGSFHGSAGATHHDDQSGERGVTDQRQVVTPAHLADRRR